MPSLEQAQLLECALYKEDFFMRNWKKTTRFLALACLSSALMLTAGCGNTSSNEGTPTPSEGTAQTETIKQGGVVRTTISSEPDHLDPHISAAADTEAIMNNVFEGLIGYTPDGAFIPQLASDYTVSSDGLTYTFTLREGVTFHNGAAVTTDDVVYSYKRLAGLNGEAPLTSRFKPVTDITTDGTTVTFTLSEPSSSFLSACTEAVIPKDYADQATKPVGTGPFSFTSYTPGQKIVLDAYPDYYDTSKKPHIDTVAFHIMSDKSSILMGLKSGTLDIGEIDTINAATLEKDFTLIERKQNMVQLLALNNTLKPFDDIRVRQAMNYAIDKDLLIEGVGNGYGTKLYTNASPAMAFWYNDLSEKEPYPYNPEKAKALLKEAGYPTGFETTIKVPSNYQFHIDTAQVIADMLSKVGITLNIELIEWGQWLETVYTGGNYETTIVGLAGKLDPQDIFIRYTTGYAKNFYHYTNPTYDKLIADANTETDADKRAALYKEAQQLLADDAVAIYIMDPPLVYAATPNLKGYTPYPAPFFDASKLYYVEN